jgi:hypothetical protein
VRIVPSLLDLEFAAAAGVALGGNLFQEVLDADLTAATAMLDDDAAVVNAKNRLIVFCGSWLATMFSLQASTTRTALSGNLRRSTKCSLSTPLGL